MVVIVEFSLPAEAFPFGRAVSGSQTVRVALERMIPLEQKRIPYLWATDHDLEAFEDGLRDSEIVTQVEALTRVDDSVLFAVEWDTDGESFLNGLAETGGAIMDAHGDDRWSFTVRFKDHADLTRFHQFYQEQEFPVHIKRVTSLSDEPHSQYGFGLTPTQREALLMAVENGYFDVPRDTKLEEIADELDITRQATSELVRRGAKKVLRKALLGLVAADFEPPDKE